VIEQPLRGWKDIAAFLGTSARSAQRWERELALPVHRIRTTTGSVVSAYPSELDAWRRAAEQGITTGSRLDAAGEQSRGTARDDALQDLIGGLLPESAAALAARTLAPPVTRRALGVGALVSVLVAAWFWLGPPAPRSRSVDGTRAAASTALRFTRGSTSVQLRAGAGQLATVVLPGVPELRVRAVPSGADLSIEIYRALPAGAAPSVLARIAALTLTRRIPGELTLAQAGPISIAWEDASPPR
jgi:hypothetical protein